MNIDFFNYYERNWNPFYKIKKVKIIPDWNYIINSLEFGI